MQQPPSVPSLPAPAGPPQPGDTPTQTATPPPTEFDAAQNAVESLPRMGCAGLPHRSRLRA